MSDIIKEMAMTLLANPSRPSSEAAHLALLFSHVAWNKSIGKKISKDMYKPVIQQIEDSNRKMWKELKSNDYNEIISGLVEYKKKYFATDKREIVVCGMRNHNVHVEWID